jgi:hypothetical protein
MPVFSKGIEICFYFERMGKTEGKSSPTLSSMETPFSSENIFKRKLPPVMAGDYSLGMDLTVPRTRTLLIMTIIHQKTLQGGINSSITDRLCGKNFRT